MHGLLESPPQTATSIAKLAEIFRQLADDVGRLLLSRGGFTVAGYLTLDGNYLVEYLDGCIQVLPKPSGQHQDLLGGFYIRLTTWAQPDPQARVRMAPFRVMVTDTAYREPDVCLMFGRHADRRFANHWLAADLVVEIISEGNRDHDEVTKRREYAAGGVPEYWLVDPEVRTCRVLTLPPGGTAYVVHGEFGPGQVATSVLLRGFAVDVAELFAAAERPDRM